MAVATTTKKTQAEAQPQPQPQPQTQDPAEQTAPMQPGTVAGGKSVVRPTIFIIQALYKGFPVEIQVEGKSDAMQEAILKLEKMGALPNPSYGSPKVGQAARQEAAQQDERDRDNRGNRDNRGSNRERKGNAQSDRGWSDRAPYCPDHNAKMQHSKKPGLWFCPSKDRDGRNGFCEYTEQE